MDIGESIGIALIQQLTAECPFKSETPEDVSIEEEDVIEDDRDEAADLQDNNGGVLGRNLINSSPGKEGTVNNFYPSANKAPEPRVDSKTQPGLKVTLQGKPYDYKVAAHHLIPGDASLANSDVYNDYMCKGADMTTKAGHTYKIRANIGYNVNGNHNGVWLPGNYGIRAGKGPVAGKSWGDIVEDPDHKDWCFEYMVACVEKVGGQFHDSHTKYNEAVLNALNKIREGLAAHQDSCEECKKKANGEIDPPYRLKTRLYLLSTYLKAKLRRQPGSYMVPWFTSDRFRDEMMRKGMMFEL
jgi:hypothetical protein